MEYKTSTRVNGIRIFMRDFEREYTSEAADNDTAITDSEQESSYMYPTSFDLFNTEYLSEGAEGRVVLSEFKRPRYMFGKVIIKQIDLGKIRKTKEIDSKILRATSQELYDLFFSSDAFTNASLIEIISQTLTNQLIIQRICPHFSLNYYWDYDEPTKTINNFGEYANGGDFYTWAKAEHSSELWYNALFQIMVGLHTMKKYFNMIHADFHARNILVHRVTPGGYWTYTIGGHKYYVPNLGYVFLLHDFGFAWIPDKVYVKWHVAATLKYITEIGMQFYDISMLIEEILESKRFNVPASVRYFLQNAFRPNETSYVMTKRYYQLNSDTYKHILRDYPDIQRSYAGSGTTLADKIHEIFYNNEMQTTLVTQSHKDKASDFVKTDFEFNYSTKPKSSWRIESFTLDKSLDRNKLPKHLRKLVA